VLHPTTAAVAARQPPTTSEGIMAEAGAGSGGSVAAAGPINIDLADDQMLTNQLSGLSVGAAAAGGAANKARGAGTANASVYGAAMRAGTWSACAFVISRVCSMTCACAPCVASAHQGLRLSLRVMHVLSKQRFGRTQCQVFAEVAHQSKETDSCKQRGHQPTPHKQCLIVNLT
jgi:hypothetical protein